MIRARALRISGEETDGRIAQCTEEPPLLPGLPDWLEPGGRRHLVGPGGRFRQRLGSEQRTHLRARRGREMLLGYRASDLRLTLLALLTS